MVNLSGDGCSPPAVGTVGSGTLHPPDTTLSVQHRDQLRAALNDYARTAVENCVRASFAARQLHLVVRRHLGTLEPPASECAAQQPRESKKNTDEGEKSDEVKETLPEWIARLIPLADQFGARLASKIDSAACEH